MANKNHRFLVILNVLLLSMAIINVSGANADSYSTPDSGVSWTMDDLVSNSQGAVTGSDGNYVVHDNVTISESDTLTINPGDTLRFDTNTTLFVMGTLIAEGTSSDMITFTSNQSPSIGGWGGIHLNGTNSVVKYSKIEYAMVGVYSISSNPALSNNVFINNKYGIYAINSILAVNSNNISSNGNSGIVFYNSSGSISNNLIANNTGYGVLMFFSEPEINDNNISKNKIHGIWVEEHSSPLIKNNVIEANDNRGIYSSSFSSPIIEGNTISQNFDGIHLTESSNAIIANNDISLNRGNGIYIWGSQSTMTNNDVKGNDYGFYCVSTSTSTIINSTILNSNVYDFSLTENCQIVVINSTFNGEKVNIADDKSALIVKNYLEVKVIDKDGSPVSGANIEVLDNEVAIYSIKTRSNGISPQIEVVNRIINYTGLHKNITLVTVKYPGLTFKNNNREVDTFYSHLEIFESRESLPEEKPDDVPDDIFEGITSSDNLCVIFAVILLVVCVVVVALVKRRKSK